MSKKFKDQPEAKYKRSTPLANKLNAWTKENISNPLRAKYPELASDADSVSSFLGGIIDPEDDVIAAEMPGGGGGSKLSKLFGFGKRGKKTAKKIKIEDELDSIVDKTKEAPPQSSSFSKLKQPLDKKAERAKQKDIAGENKAVKDSKTREVHDTLQDDIKKSIEKTDRRPEIRKTVKNPTPKVKQKKFKDMTAKEREEYNSRNAQTLDYSKMK